MHYCQVMLSTPLGDLTTLDLSDPQIQQAVLFYDKHQLLEGIVAENHIDQILDAALGSDPHLKPLNVVSVMAATSKNKLRTVLVLDQGTATELLNPYLLQLAVKFPTKLVRYDPEKRDFITHKGQYTEGSALDKPYGELVKALGSSGGFAGVQSAVRDELRQKQGFWGQLVGAYGDRLGRSVVLPRLFKNFAVQPYFDRGVWDIDRVYQDTRQNTFGVIEVKHKYPFGKDPWPLQFGLNCGSCSVLRDLAGAGFQCFHSIMVKPFWKDSVSVTYLFNDVQARSRVMFCGKRFSFTELDALYRQRARRSPQKTTLTGQGEMEYVSFPASSLYKVGLLNDPDLPAKFAGALSGLPQLRITDQELQTLRMDKP
jgi:hypothetical protein